jgi:uncharacterized protein
MFGKKNNFYKNIKNMEELKFNLEELREYAIKHWNKSDIHGIEHWDNVYKNALKLKDNDINLNVLYAFAYLHDSARFNDGIDLYHGARAVENVKKLSKTILKNLNEEEIIILCHACQYHNIEDRTTNNTVNACYDADRLDLIRVNIIPDPFQMASKKGAEIATELYWER